MTNNKRKYKNCVIHIHDDNKENVEILKDIKEDLFNDALTLTRIGVESSNAYAMIAKGYKYDKLVIKTPRKKNGTVDSLKYEYIVGQDIRNHLIPYCPNFAKIYGYAHKGTNEYLIIERILPGLSFREYFEKNNKIFDNKALSLCLQVVYALQLANTRMPFTHYDLHFGNVLIRQPTKQPLTSITYAYKHKGVPTTATVPIYDNHVSVIIDYGRSYTEPSTKSYFDEETSRFKPYKFLLKHGIDVRKHSKTYDIQRFCSVLLRYFPKLKKVLPDVKVLKEPIDAVPFLHNFYSLGNK